MKEYKIYSQNGEDGIISYMVDRIGIKQGFFIEIGCSPEENNTRALKMRGWRGVQIDSHEAVDLVAHVTAENINDLVLQAGLLGDSLQINTDLISIDIDLNTYHIWKAIKTRPKIVCVEYNAKFPLPQRAVTVYEPFAKWDGTDYFGASLQSFIDLATERRYTLFCCDSTGTNAFFIRNDFLDLFKIKDPEELYRPVGYKPHPVSDRW